MTTISRSATAYRADIDGLRAVAVLAVLVFHAFPSALPGGFVGVDVFFVISGFLITGILLRAHGEERFRYRDFCAQRVRRIFPALLLVLAAVLGFGWWVLLPDEFAALGRHALGGAGFVANLVFWREAGYFDAAGEAKPLLHLWSLGIEEQFYIAWPLLIALAWRRRWPMARVLWAVVLASFLLNVLTVGGWRSAAFYSPLSRAWELAAGGLLACVRPREGRAGPHALSVLGLLLIAAALVFVRGGKAFPGWWALLPVAGAACCIAAGPGSVVNRLLLGNRAMVGLGLVSYPLYLWHWPLLSYLRIVSPHEPSAAARVAVLAASLLLAVLSYAGVEQVLRRRAGALRLLGAGMALAALAGCAVRLGLPPRLHAPLLQRVADASADRDYGIGPVSDELGPFLTFRAGSGARRVLLIGDSHVMQYAPRAGELARRLPRQMATTYFTVFLACPPIPGVRMREGGGCGDTRDAGLRMAVDTRFDAVVVGACWSCYFTDTLALPMRFDLHEGGAALALRSPQGEARALAALGRLLAELAKDGRKVYLLLDNPGGADFDPARMLEGSRLGRLHVASAATLPLAPAQAALNGRLGRLAREHGAEPIDVLARLCIDGACLRSTPDGSPAYMDAHHLRPAFTRAFADYLDPVLLGGEAP